ncbi:MAG: MMPL family transporter [Nocardioides sp.]|uniref:MMPL family transporter n=1 Tax=Nocardioides sp. TaxID=35761 RepID=UPI003F03046D
MAELLYRLGRFSARRAWLVICTWLVALALAAGGYFAFGGALQSAVTMPGTPTVEVADKLAAHFPEASGGAATVVFQSDDGKFTPVQRAQIEDVLEQARAKPGVKQTVSPFAPAEQIAEGLAELDEGQRTLDETREGVTSGAYGLDEQQTADALAGLDSQQAQLDDARALLDMASDMGMVSEDGTTALGTVMFDKPVNDLAPETKEAVADVLLDAELKGVTVELSNELVQAIPSVMGPGEAVGLVIAAITLFVMLGTLIGAGLPIITAITGVGVGVAGSLAFSSLVDMMSVTPVLGVMLGLAVGIDYSLFIINRHRNQLRDGVPLAESIGLANGTSGNAVVFAGATVITALAALNVTGIGFLGLMGTVGAACVAVAILVAVTLTPALLSLVGLRLLPRRQRAERREPKPVAHVRPMKTWWAVVSAVLGTALLLVIALPALSMRLGLPDGSSEPVDSTQYRAYSLIEEQFGAGMNGPLVLVAEYPTPLAEEQHVAEQVRVGQRILEQDNVAAVAPIGVSENSQIIAFQVVPVHGPNAEETVQLVRDLRDLSPLSGPDTVAQVGDAGGAVMLGVAGTASGNIDISAKLGAALPGYLALVVGLSLVILVLVFRSILVPLTATLGFVLSLAATFGALTAIFQWGWLGSIFGVHDPAPILSFLPTIVIGVLFGLAMDYQLFLVSGMRESYVHGAPAREAVVRGLRSGRTVVTAAAIIMVAVFAGFIFAHNNVVRLMGFGLAFGVLVDAFIVRMLIIPAVMHLLGRAAWWLPAWLDRILPSVDVEGAALERAHPDAHLVHPEDGLADLDAEAERLTDEESSLAGR